MKRLLFILVGGFLASCSAGRLISEVSYRSFRNLDPMKHQISSLQEIPANAEIAIATSIDVKEDEVNITVYNLTDSTMTIDRTQSFFIYPDRQVPYYDPTITTHTHTSSTGSGSGASLNLGAVAGAIGIGGIAGTLMGGVNVGGSRSSGNSNSTTTYDIDQPIIHIPPHGHASLQRKFSIHDVLSGKGYTADENNQAFFGVCIAYSKDRMKSLRNFISAYYMRDLIIERVRREGRFFYPNEALRKIYTAKPDLFTEKLYWIYFDRKEHSFGYPEFDYGTQYYGEFSLYDYK